MRSLDEQAKKRERVLFLFIAAGIMFLVDLMLFLHRADHVADKRVWIHMDLKSEADIGVRLLAGDTPDALTDTCRLQQFPGGSNAHSVPMSCPLYAKYIGIGFEGGEGDLTIRDLSVFLGGGSLQLQQSLPYAVVSAGELLSVETEENGDVRIFYEDEPFVLILDTEDWQLQDSYARINRWRSRAYLLMKCLAADLLIAFAAAYLWKKKNPVVSTAQGGGKKAASYEIFLVLAVFLICLCGACMIGGDYCPDEPGRGVITDYIYENGRLPEGSEQEVAISGWGFSYALRPYLYAIVNAFWKKAAAIFTSSEAVLGTMSRMCSVLSVTGSAWFLLQTGKELFRKRGTAVLVMSMVCFIPQVLFLGMYQNVDSLSLFSVCMELCFLVKGHRNRWGWRECAGLALSIAIGILSYYTIYFWLLAGGIFFLVSVFRTRRGERGADSAAARILMVAGMVLFLSGWFFIRNGLLHGGDFLGIRYEEVMREAASDNGDYLYSYNRGYDLADSMIHMVFRDFPGWGRMTMRSLIGYFGYMDMPIDPVWYGKYYMLFLFAILFGALFCLWKKTGMLQRMVFLFATVSAVSVILLSILQSYYRDYQPQGRYIVTVLPALALFAGGAAEYLFASPDGATEDRNLPDAAFLISLLLIVMFIRIWFSTMEIMVV